MAKKRKRPTAHMKRTKAASQRSEYLNLTEVEREMRMFGQRKLRIARMRGLIRRIK